jgi:hypothetical protein
MALSQVQTHFLAGYLRQHWKRLGINNVFVAVMIPTNQHDEAMLNEYQHHGYTLQVITKSSTTKLISKLSDLYGLDYFIKQYPLNISSYRRNEFVKSRLNNGEICFAIMHKGEIAHINWIGFENTCLKNRMIMARNLELDLSTIAYTYNAYTGEQHRGKRLQLLCFFHIFKFLKESRYQFIFGLIGARNTASMKIAALVGKFTGVVIEENFLLFKRYVFVPIDFPGF